MAIVTRTTLAAFAISLVLSFVFAHILTSRIIRPIEETAYNLKNRNVKADTLHAAFPKELSEIAAAFLDVNEEISCLRADFENLSSFISHEQKNSLALLRAVMQNECSSVVAERTTVQIDHMVKNLDDILSLSANESVLEKVDLPLVCGMAVDEYKKVYPDISVDFDEDAALYIAGQELLVYRAVSNLIDNAVKYGQDKPVVVYVGIQRDCPYVSVEDFGIGIHMEQQEKIFENRFRIGNRKKDGYGIRLSLVRHVAELCGGFVWVDSRENCGSKFKIVFPAFTLDLRKLFTLMESDENGMYHNPEITTEQYIAFSRSDAVKSTLFQGSRQTYSNRLIGLDQGGEEESWESGTDNVFLTDSQAVTHVQRQAPNTTVVGYSDNSMMEDFTLGLRELDEGRLFAASGECMVSRDFADLNGLKLGDQLELQDVNSTDVETLYLTICGIYLDITTPQPNGDNWAVNNRRNEILTSFSTLEEHSNAGLDVCREGTISYNGENLKCINRDKYRTLNIGVVFRSYNLLLNASAVENVVLSMNLSGDRSRGKKQSAYRLLEKVGIDRVTADRKILKLSGGEQQRTGIARALSHNPDILIADESTRNLDEDTEEEIMQILTSLVKNEGCCVILATHSHKVASYADEVLGLSDGRLVTVNQRSGLE